MIAIFYHHDHQGRAGLLVPWMVVTFLFLVYDLVSLTIAIIIHHFGYHHLRCHQHHQHMRFSLYFNHFSHGKIR